MYVISGKNFVVKNENIGDSAFVEIAPDRKYSAVLVKCRTAVALQIKRYSADTEYVTIPAGESLSLAISMGVNNPFYLKSASGAVVAELLFVE